jgi:hypothetical protein
VKIVGNFRRLFVTKKDGVAGSIVYMTGGAAHHPVQDWEYEEEAEVLYQVLRANLPRVTWSALAYKFQYHSGTSGGAMPGKDTSETIDPCPKEDPDD